MGKKKDYGCDMDRIPQGKHAVTRHILCRNSTAGIIAGKRGDTRKRCLSCDGSAVLFVCYEWGTAYGTTISMGNPAVRFTQHPRLCWNFDRGGSHLLAGNHLVWSWKYSASVCLGRRRSGGYLGRTQEPPPQT